MAEHILKESGLFGVLLHPFFFFSLETLRKPAPFLFYFVIIVQEELVAKYNKMGQVHQYLFDISIYSCE